MSDPVVRHFRQILIWPVQLIPQRPGVQIQRHWEHLDAAGSDNHWRELKDEFSGDPDTYRERHYREFVTFLPHVQRFLYGQGRGGETRRGYGESPMRIFRRHDIAFADLSLSDDVSIELAVQHTDLYFFYDIDVVLLVLEVYANDLPLKQVEDILFRFGRTFPAEWNEKGDPLQCLKKVKWLDHDRKVLAESDNDQRERFLSYVAEHRAPRIASHWDFLMRPMVQHHSEEHGPLRYRQLEYHRMPKATFLSFDDPFALPREEFLRLGLAARPDDGEGLPYSEQVLLDFEREHCYDRFWEPQRRIVQASTRIIVNSTSFVMIGMHGNPKFIDPEYGLLGQFRHQYFQLVLIAHFHKAALLMLSDRLILAVSRLDIRNALSIKAFKRSIRQTIEIFLRFNHRYWFHEVSKQTVAKDVFRMLIRDLNNDGMFDEVREEIFDMSNYLDSDDTRRQSDTILHLTVVTIVGMIAAIVTGFLGMNLIDETGEPVWVRITYFLMVLAPTIFVTTFLVTKSRAISEFLDALSDERISWRAKFRVLRKALKKQRTTSSEMLTAPPRKRARTPKYK